MEFYETPWKIMEVIPWLTALYMFLVQPDEDLVFSTMESMEKVKFGLRKHHSFQKI